VATVPRSERCAGRSQLPHQLISKPRDAAGAASPSHLGIGINALFACRLTTVRHITGSSKAVVKMKRLGDAADDQLDAAAGATAYRGGAEHSGGLPRSHRRSAEAHHHALFEQPLARAAESIYGAELPFIAPASAHRKFRPAQLIEMNLRQRGELAGLATA
jgi:hypothetical protein